jgi:hypothetical protein
LGWERAESAWLLALAALALVSAFVRARAAVPDAERAAAWLDVAGGARGQLVTERELGPSAWSEAARAQLETAMRALPVLPWRRAVRRPLPAAAFAALALWVPIPRTPVGPPPIVTRAALEDLREKLATLEETVELAPEVAQELETRLEHVEEEAASGRPASTFEALDRLEERLDAKAEEALEAAQRAGLDLAAANNDPDLGAAQAALESALAGMKQAGLGKEAPKALEQALQAGSLSLPEGVQLSSAELGALARDLKGALDSRLAKLTAGRLLDPSKLRPLEPGELPSLDDFDPEHVCDEDCKKPGGT